MIHRLLSHSPLESKSCHVAPPHQHQRPSPVCLARHRRCAIHDGRARIRRQAGPRVQLGSHVGQRKGFREEGAGACLFSSLSLAYCQTDTVSSSRQAQEGAYFREQEAKKLKARELPLPTGDAVPAITPTNPLEPQSARSFLPSASTSTRSRRPSTTSRRSKGSVKFKSSRGKKGSDARKLLLSGVTNHHTTQSKSLPCFLPPCLPRQSALLFLSECCHGCQVACGRFLSRGGRCH